MQNPQHADAVNQIPACSVCTVPAVKRAIKHRDGTVLFEAEIPGDTPSGLMTRVALEQATQKGAYLTGAYLTGADLTGADLRGAYLTGAEDDPLRSTDAESIENLDKVRAVILDNQARLEMGHWHGSSEWQERTCAEEAVCGTTHCLAGWLQVCTTKPELRLMPPEVAGALCAPVAAKMFFLKAPEVLSWLEERKYVVEIEEAIANRELARELHDSEAA